MQTPRQRVTPAGQGAPVGAARPARAGEGGRLLAPALRADRVDPGHRRRRQLHRRQRPAAGHQPADAHLAASPSCCSSSTSGGGAGCCRSSAVGLWALVAIVGRRDRTRVRAAVPGRAGRVVEGGAVHRAQHRRHPGGASGSTTSRSTPVRPARRRPRRPSTWPTTPTPSATSGCGTRAQHILGQTFRAAAGHPRATTRSTTSTSTATSSTASTPRSMLSVRELNSRGRSRGQLVGGPAPHLHPRLRRGHVAGQRQGPRTAGRPSWPRTSRPRQRRRASSSPSPRVYIGEDLGRLRRSSATRPAAASCDLRGRGRDRGSRSYEGDDGVGARRRSSGGRRSPSASATSTRSSPATSTTSSRILLMPRRPRAGARRSAPFLDFDGDPYPVVVDGRIVWVIDAYTTTDRYPYAQRVETGQRPDRQRPRPPVQLRAQLGEGRGRRLRRHRRLLRDRRGRPDGSRPTGRPSPSCSRTRGAARGAAGPLPLPGGPLPDPDQHVGEVPRDATRTTSTRATTSGMSPSIPAPAGHAPGRTASSSTTTTAADSHRRPARAGSTRTTSSPSSLAPRLRSSCCSDRSCPFGPTTTASS